MPQHYGEGAEIPQDGPSVAKPLGPKDVVARGSEKKSQSNDSPSMEHAERHNMPRQGTRSLLATVTFMLPWHSSLCPLVRIDGPRGGVNWVFFKFLKQIKATLTNAMLVRLNSPTG